MVVELVRQWDGPSDVDLGGYEDGIGAFHDDERVSMEKQYAQTILAAIYSAHDDSAETFTGAHSVLSRIATLLKVECPPGLDSLEDSSDLVGLTDNASIRAADASQLLYNSLLQPNSVFTDPSQATISFLHQIIMTAAVLRRLNHPVTITRAAMLVAFASEDDQRQELQKLLHHISMGPRRDGGDWVRIREEVRWLRGWGVANSAVDRGGPAPGIFGKVDEKSLEREILKALLQASRKCL